MNHFVAALALFALAGLAAFSVRWSLKTGWASSKRYLIGRDYSRKKNPEQYWSVVRFNALFGAMMFAVAIYLLFRTDP